MIRFDQQRPGPGQEVMLRRRPRDSRGPGVDRATFVLTKHNEEAWRFHEPLLIDHHRPGHAIETETVYDDSLCLPDDEWEPIEPPVDEALIAEVMADHRRSQRPRDRVLASGLTGRQEAAMRMWAQLHSGGSAPADVTIPAKYAARAADALWNELEAD